MKPQSAVYSYMCLRSLIEEFKKDVKEDKPYLTCEVDNSYLGYKPDRLFGEVISVVAREKKEELLAEAFRKLDAMLKNSLEVAKAEAAALLEGEKGE